MSPPSLMKAAEAGKLKEEGRLCERAAAHCRSRGESAVEATLDCPIGGGVPQVTAMEVLARELSADCRSAEARSGGRR